MLPNNILTKLYIGLINLYPYSYDQFRQEMILDMQDLAADAGNSSIFWIELLADTAFNLVIAQTQNTYYRFKTMNKYVLTAGTAGVMMAVAGTALVLNLQAADKPEAAVKVSLPPVVTTVSVPAYVNPLSDSSCNGYIWTRGYSDEAQHYGVDLAFNSETCVIVSACTGTVAAAEYATDPNSPVMGAGYYVQVTCRDGMQTYYEHGNGNFYVHAGDQVNSGQKLMNIGSSGNSIGTHLHFSMRQNGKWINPETYINLHVLTTASLN